MASSGVELEDANNVRVGPVVTEVLGHVRGIGNDPGFHVLFPNASHVFTTAGSRAVTDKQGGLVHDVSDVRVCACG